MYTSSFLISLIKCSCKLEGRRPGLKLKRFLDGVLHQAVATEGACYSHTMPLSPHSSTSLVLSLRATTLEGVSQLSLQKSNKRFVETFCWKRLKITFLLVQQAQRLGDLASNAVLVLLGQQSRRQGLVRRKKLEIRLSINSDLSRNFGQAGHQPAALLVH